MDDAGVASRRVVEGVQGRHRETKGIARYDAAWHTTDCKVCGCPGTDDDWITGCRDAPCQCVGGGQRLNEID